jgi:hypothetical protein
MLKFFLLLFALAADEPLSDWRQSRVVAIPTDLHHVQGIDVEGDTFWVSSVDARAGKGYLTRLSLSTGAVLAQVEVQQDKRLHPGGIMLDGDSLWIPVAEYDRDGPTNIERRNKLTLALESRFEVNDHIGCLAIRGDLIVGGSWGSRTLYSWTRDGKQLSRQPNPFPTEWQDLKFDGDLLLGSGGLSKSTGAIEWLRWPGLELVRRITTGVTDRGLTYSHEGMAYRGGKLYLLPEDAPSRLFVFTR